MTPDSMSSVADLSRVVVIGTSCSGKTTLARDLAKRLDVDHFELDALHWLPGWVAREPEEFRTLVIEHARGDAWVTEGQYRIVRKHLFERASTIIWLNYPFPLVFWRAIKRTTHRAFTGQKICGDNRESIRIAFFNRHSIILWVITSFRRRRREYRALFDGNSFSHATKLELTDPADARAFLLSVTSV